MDFIENGLFIANETNTLRANATNEFKSSIRGIRAKSKTFTFKCVFVTFAIKITM